MTVTFKGAPLQVEGTLPALGVPGPDFALQTTDGTTVTRQSLMGKKTLVSTFPDIDTSVCTRQAKTLADKFGKGGDVNVVHISTNTLAEDQAWCDKQGVDAVFLPDPAGAFGRAYGVFIPEKNILARSLMVLDERGNVIYAELVDELTKEPNYQAAYAVL